MEISDAMDLIGPAVPPTGGTWADFGAGAGTFTQALAALAGSDARILAVEKDPRALRSLQNIASAKAGAATVVPIHGDFRHLESIRELSDVELDGALFSNSLHFLPDADLVLVRVARLLRAGGKIVVVEYEDRPASRWVPYPLGLDRLSLLAGRAGLEPPRVAGTKPSQFGGKIYCAVLQRTGA